MKIVYYGSHRHMDQPAFDILKKLEPAGWEIDWDEYARWEGMYITAYRSGLSLEEAKAEFEEITGEDPDYQAECDVCDGTPHEFCEED